MYWNHRVVKTVGKFGGVECFAIHEAYYDEAPDNKLGWTQDPVAVVGDSIEELRFTLESMLAALDEEVIDNDV